MTEADLLLLLELLGGLHDDTNSRKVADATLVVKRACQARLSRLRRQPRIPAMPFYFDPLQIDFVTDQTPTAVDNPVDTVDDRRLVGSATALQRLHIPGIPVVVDPSLDPEEAYLVNTRTGQRLRIDYTSASVKEVTTDGKAERPEEGEALLTPDWPDQLPD